MLNPGDRMSPRSQTERARCARKPHWRVGARESGSTHLITPDETNLYEQAVVNRARDRGHGIIPDLYSASPAAPPRGGGRAVSRVAAPSSLPRAGSRCPSSFHEVRLG